MNNVFLYTLGNVKTTQDTLCTFPNPSPDPYTNRRSQELYDALSRKFHITGWACGRYGQHAYSPDAGEKFARELERKIKSEKRLSYDFSIQMAGHPIIKHTHPSFIIVDFIPYFDLSIMDKISFPYVMKTNPMDQDFLYHDATGIITYTPVQRYMLINWLNIDPCRVTSICSGVTGFVDKEWVKKRSKNILWVGSNLYGKGGADLINAYHILKESDDEYTLTMVGIDPKLVDDPDVTVYPFLHGSDLCILDNLYKDTGVFVMPSYKENLGLVYLEAMAHKVPVIVTSRGGMAEMIRRTNSGMVVSPGNIDAIVDGIREICEGQEYEKMSERAYSFAMENAQWDIVADRIFDAVTRWLNKLPVPDDYNKYFVSPSVECYKQQVDTQTR